MNTYVYNNINYTRRDYELEREWEIHRSSCRGVVVGDIWYVINGVNIVVLQEILKKVNKNENDKTTASVVAKNNQLEVIHNHSHSPKLQREYVVPFSPSSPKLKRNNDAMKGLTMLMFTE